MHFSNIPPQEEWFRQEGWNAERDKLFVEAIEVFKKDFPWEGADIPVDVLEDVSHTVMEAYEINLSWESICRRVQMLKSRYNTFKKLASDNRARYHQESSIVTATDPIWAELFQEDYFAQAYYREGEPLFIKLAFLFGQEDVKLERTVILISDSTRELRDGHFGVQNLIDDDEVTSPVIKTVPRRKLSFDGGEGDNESADDHTYVIIDDSPLKNKRATSKLPKKYGASSCASSSPGMWNKIKKKFG